MPPRPRIPLLHKAIDCSRHVSRPEIAATPYTRTNPQSSVEIDKMEEPAKPGIRAPAGTGPLGGSTGAAPPTYSCGCHRAQGHDRDVAHVQTIRLGNGQKDGPRQRVHGHHPPAGRDPQRHDAEPPDDRRKAASCHPMRHHAEACSVRSAKTAWRAKHDVAAYCPAKHPPLFGPSDADSWTQPALRSRYGPFGRITIATPPAPAPTIARCRAVPCPAPSAGRP